MKGLLDRLLTRQHRLMHKLAESGREARQRAGKPSQERIGQEQAALAAAAQALEQGNVDAARGLLEPFADAPSDPRVLVMLSRIEVASGMAEKALANLRRAEQMSPTDTKVWRLMAEALARCRRHTEEVQYRRKLAFAAGDVPAQAHVDWVRALLRAAPQTQQIPVNEVRLAVRKLQSAADATPDLRLRMAEALFAFDGDPFDQEARELYRSAAPCPANARDVTARWIRMIEWCEASGAELTRLVDEGAPGFRPMVARLRDVDLYPAMQWSPVVDGGKAVIKGFAMHGMPLWREQPSTPALMNNRRHVELRLAATPRLIDQPALLIGGSQNVYRHTVEHLSSLAVAEEAGVVGDLPLVVNDDLAPFQLEQFKLLGYGENRLIRVPADQPTRFEQLVVPSRLVKRGAWIDPLLPRWCRRRFVVPGGAAARRLFVVPSAPAAPGIANQDELGHALAARGFDLLEADRLSVRECIDAFAGAAHVVGLARDALANMVFAPPGAIVVALYNRYAAAPAAAQFDALAAACGHRYLGITCAPPALREGEAFDDSPLLVDVAALLADLDDLDSRPSPTTQISA